MPPCHVCKAPLTFAQSSVLRCPHCSEPACSRHRLPRAAGAPGRGDVPSPVTPLAPEHFVLGLAATGVDGVIQCFGCGLKTCRHNTTDQISM